jgi:hypothetical protein
VLSTSRHEFFGVSVMEAIFMGCAPVLPRRLTYPAIALGEGAFLYDDPGEIPAKVAALLGADLGEAIRPLRERIMQFDAASVVARWDDLIDSVIGHREG